MSSKDDFSLWWNNIWCFLLFEDKGRLHAHHNRIKRGLLPGQSLSSELERDRCRQELSWEFRYSWLGLFNCWNGHNYPVPCSPLHAPRSGAHWPYEMEYFTPFPLETNSRWLLAHILILQRLSSHFGYFILRRLRNISYLRRLRSISYLRRLRNISYLRRLRNISYLRRLCSISLLINNIGIRTEMVIIYTDMS